MEIPRPYVLFLGDAADPVAAKTADGIARWRPDWCLGQIRLPGCVADCGLPDLTPAEAVAQGARTLVVGVANAGGYLAESWLDLLDRALDAGLDIASGLHMRLSDQPRLVATANRTGRHLFDVRHPTGRLAVGTGERRPGRRVLTVGTDCSVGKMYAALALEAEMRARGLNADFRATGQTGILIAGGGISVDAVVADFIAGAAESLSPAAEPDHWDVVEGQGSLFHPAFAGVTLGLLHGSQPDFLVLCHEPTRPHVRHCPHMALPDLDVCLEAHLAGARLTNPAVRAAGVAVNTAALDANAAHDLLAEIGRALDLPCVDPVRTGVGPIVDRLLAA